jgi:RHS repeat-associated protein
LNTTVYTFDPIQSWPSPGFTIGFGRIAYYDWQADFTYAFMLIDPDGTRHYLGRGHQSNQNTLQTTDGTHITYVGSVTGGGTLYYQDGTKVTIGFVNNRLLPTQVITTDGNYCQLAYKQVSQGFAPMALDFVVDTLGRVIQFVYSGTNLTSINPPSGYAATFSYQTVTMNTNFQNEIVVENVGSSFQGVSTLAAGYRPPYTFTYSGYGLIYSINWSSGGQSGSVTYNYPTGGEELYAGPTFSQRTETATNSPTGVYTYSGNVITRPDGSTLTLTSTQSEIKNSAGVSFAKTVFTYVNDPGGSPQVQSVTSYDDTNTPTKVEFDHDQYGNILNQREYGWKIGGLWKVRRRTRYTYLDFTQYIDAYIRNRVSKVEVFDALENTTDSDDVLVGKSEFQYDNYSAMGGMENYGGAAAPPGHLSSYDTSKTTRGNVTGVTTYSDLLSGGFTRSSKIDIFGGVTKTQVSSCCNQKSFVMTEATYWARASQITIGDTAGIYLTGSQAFNFNSLSATSQTDPNNQTTTCSHDSAGNPTSAVLPTGATVSTSYNAWSDSTSSTINYNEGGGAKSITTSSTYNGWGQLTQSVDASGAQTNYTYDNMGRRVTQTNPFPQGGTPGPVTTYGYDPLGRQTTVTLPGGNTIQTAYVGGNIVTVTDQVNRKIKRESDGLGRLTKVTEQDVTTGNLTQETTYTYDIADHLIGVNQGSQTRAFKYDAEGHLLFERIPEMTATINDGTGTYWTTKYTYTSFGAVASKQDASGVIIIYGYDNLNRLTQVTYNTSGAPGVAPTPTVTYNYDTNQSSSTNGKLLSVTVGSSYSESYNYSVGVGNGGNGGNTLNLSSLIRAIDGHNYTTSYQYNTANQLTQMTYPSGRVISFGHDNKGRVSSVGAYLTSLTYNGIGQLTGSTLGNGVNESYGYDANRMQLTSQKATKSGGPTNGLMNLSYSYQASAGQMGSGSTAGNADQLMSVTGTINQTTESAAYTYDDLGRIVTSNQTSNGSMAQRRFSYDRWGNRTTMWDATSGGTQIQSITLAQSGGVATNQIASVTSGSTLNYSYDSAGNVTNDGVHGYAYDAENRLISVDAGATGTYAYDHSNQRYKKATGGATTQYIWQGSQVIAEYNGGTGAVTAEYVYSGSRMIAKIASEVTQYFLSDRLSVRMVLDSAGNASGRQGHLPFGEDFAESGIQEKRHFTSYERDGESSSDYAVNRHYSQTIGRFNRPDPIRAFCHSQRDPQELNRYTYTVNNPVNNRDSLGLDSDPLFPPDPNDPIVPYDYAILCALFPQYCVHVNASGVPFAIVRDVMSETGGETGATPVQVSVSYLQAYKRTSLSDKSGKIHYFATCKSKFCFRPSKWVWKDEGEYLQCGGAAFITPIGIACVGACFGVPKKGRCV